MLFCPSRWISTSCCGCWRPICGWTGATSSIRAPGAPAPPATAALPPAPPAEELAALRHLARLGDIGGLRERLTSIEALDEQYQPFVAELRRLAGHYQTHTIQTMLDRYGERA